MSGMFGLSQPQQDQVHAWWNGLQPQDRRSSLTKQEGNEGKKNSFTFFHRGHLARLRRAASLHNLALEEAPHKLLDRLLSISTQGNFETVQLENALPLIAGAVAHVRSNTSAKTSLAKSVGHSVIKRGENPAVSEIRFKRLLNARDEEDFFSQLRRILAQDRAPINVGELARDVFAWHLERSRPERPTQTMRYRWARDYYLDSKASAPRDTESTT